MTISLKEKYKDYFHIGTCVSAESIDTHKDLILEQFSSITPENQMKWDYSWPQRNMLDYSSSDKIMSFAKQNNLAVRGHTLVWHNQTPPWVFEGATRESLLSLMRERIEIMGKKYIDQIFCWDVVNEGIDDKNDLFFRQSKWTEIIGNDFIDYAFKFARETMPNTELYYNDYNECFPVKSKKIFDLVKSMKDRGIPIDGVGMQAHWNIYEPNFDEIKRAIELYASLGLKIQVTEMDISLFEFNDHSSIEKPTPELLEKQAEMYGFVFKLFREYKEQINSVTFWGEADDRTWLDNFPAKGRKNWPMVFDVNHNPKEAFYRITDFYTT